MNELELALKKVLADTFTMYFKAHVFHWNVEGPDFKQYHDFFGGLYEELFDAVDPIAEHCRALGYYTQTSLKQMLDLKIIPEQEQVLTDPRSMARELLTNNDMIIVSLMRAYQEAEKATELGLCNFLQDRIDVHTKHGWMLRAVTK